MYSDKMQSFQDTLTSSSQVFEKLKKELDEVGCRNITCALPCACLTHKGGRALLPLLFLLLRPAQQQPRTPAQARVTRRKLQKEVNHLRSKTQKTDVTLITLVEERNEACASRPVVVWCDVMREPLHNLQLKHCSSCCLPSSPWVRCVCFMARPHHHSPQPTISTRANDTTAHPQ